MLNTSGPVFTHHVPTLTAGTVTHASSAGTHSSVVHCTSDLSTTAQSPIVDVTQTGMLTHAAFTTEMNSASVVPSVSHSGHLVETAARQSSGCATAGNTTATGLGGASETHGTMNYNA